MPGIKTHTAQALLSGAAILPFSGPAGAAAFSLSVVLIDIDHVIEYVRQTRSLKLPGVFPCCSIIQKNLSRFYVLNAFHTAEFLLLTALLGLLHPVFFYITAGMLWHWSLDTWVLARKGAAFRRALSIVEYCIRARSPGNIIWFKDLLQRGRVEMPDDGCNYRQWLEHWRSCQKTL